MMATTLVPPNTVPPRTPSGDLRFVAVRAKLLPDEVIGARQAQVVRKQVLIALVVVAVLLVGWYAVSWWQTTSANSSLDSARHQGVALQNQQAQFAPLVQAQNDINTIQSELQLVMVGDLPWTQLLSALRAKATGGVSIQTVSGTVLLGATSGGGPVTPSVLNQSGSATAGTLTLTGTAPDKRTVASFADRLGTVTGLTGALISRVNGASTGRSVQFTISAVITAAALGGRYSKPATSTSIGGN